MGTKVERSVETMEEGNNVSPICLETRKFRSYYPCLLQPMFCYSPCLLQPMFATAPGLWGQLGDKEFDKAVGRMYFVWPIVFDSP